jgi:hypothetical protein
MPIGVNRVGLMGSAGGGGAGASLIQSASGGSQWNGTNPRQGGLPVRFHRCGVLLVVEEDRVVIMVDLEVHHTLRL